MTNFLRKLEDEVSAWPQLSVHPHRFGGREFRFGSAEVGHMHTGGAVDIPFPCSIRDRLLAEGLAEDVEATANEFGVIDFSGSRGHVRLNVANEININLLAQHFDGTLEAVAERPVRVLLPPAFASPFEAVVTRERDFVCRADVCAQMKRSRRDGHVVFTYGSGEALLRFRSVNGPIVIDSTGRLAKLP